MAIKGQMSNLILRTSETIVKKEFSRKVSGKGSLSLAHDVVVRILSNTLFPSTSDLILYELFFDQIKVYIRGVTSLTWEFNPNISSHADFEGKEGNQENTDVQ